MKELLENKYTTICALVILLTMIAGLGFGWLTERQINMIIGLAASLGLIGAKDAVK